MPRSTARSLPALVGALVAAALIVWAWASTPRGEVDTGTLLIAGAAVAQRPARAPTPPPPVEPVELAAIAPEDAVKLNAAVPFSTIPNPAARPFRFNGGTDARALATDCLAAAMAYEAGTEGEDGMRAVAQVVLNRVRHPAFPKTVCAVVFQGQERRTGCQFTFTCDGALVRYPTPPGWERARRLAEQAIGGRVFRPVGQATHYHTNWVLPYWSGSLDKIVAVGTHLFFRWSGWWGTPPAFTGRQAGAEPAVAKLAPLSEAHRTALSAGEIPAIEGGVPDAVTVAAQQQRPGEPMLPAGPVAPPLLADAAPKLAADEGGGLIAPGEDSFILLLDPARPDSFPDAARRACGTKPFCKVQAWTDRAQVPAGYPIPAERLGTMAFSYLRDRAAGFDKMLWNCRTFPRDDRGQCMR